MLKAKISMRKFACGRVSAPWQRLAAAVGFASSFMGCASAPEFGDGQGESEPVASTSEKTIGPLCDGTRTTRCWQRGWSGPNFRTFDFASGLACAVQTAGDGRDGYTYRKVLCGTSVGSLPNNAGYGHTNSEAPNDIKSIAIRRSYDPSTSILILGQDNVVRRTTGRLGQTWYGAGNFETYSEYVKALDSNGTAICMKKIVVTKLPSPSTPLNVLLGLSCTGALYYAKQQNGSFVWFPGSTAAPWNGFPSSLRFEDMGHDDGEWGLYLLEAFNSSQRRIFRIGKGTFDAAGSLTWSAPETLPKLYDSWNNEIKATAIGGRFVMTNAGGYYCTAVGQPCAGENDRFFRYSGTGWVNTRIGTPVYPENQGQLGVGPLLLAPLVDASSFVSSDGESLAVWHYSNRLYTYHWL
jgi:hypothetical protein